MGDKLVEQAHTASEALAECDIVKARKVLDARRAIRDLDRDALTSNSSLFAIHQPVVRDLRLVLTLSRAVCDLERISGEAVRLADVALELYEYQPSVRECVIFEDVSRMARPAVSRLENGLKALADEDVQAATEVALDGKEIEELFSSSLRRLAAYLVEDPRNIRWVIVCTLGIKAMERIGDHACSIARNIIYSVTGKDVRHASILPCRPGEGLAGTDAGYILSRVRK